MAAFIGTMGHSIEPKLYLLHEQMGTHGSVGYNMAKPDLPEQGEGPRWRPPFRDVEFVFHLVRDPRKVIKSCEENFPEHVGLKKTLGINNGHNWQDAWCNWNVVCEERIEEAKASGCHTDFCKFEDRIEFGNRVAEFFGYKKTAEEAASEINFHNTRKQYDAYKWSDLQDNVLEMAERYGYNLAED